MTEQNLPFRLKMAADEIELSDVTMPGYVALMRTAAATIAEMEAALENALRNEGQDACCLPILKQCDCWRCQARAALAKAGAK